MDRIFLDANVLFSAAYRAGSGLLELWKIKAVLCTSRYAFEEARINLSEEIQTQRLLKIGESLRLFVAADVPLPVDIYLPEKDRPILLAAMAASATHLLTGDLRHFGPYLGKRICGILILLPAEYLRTRVR